MMADDGSLRASASVDTLSRLRKSLYTPSCSDAETMGKKPGDCGTAPAKGTGPLSPPYAYLEVSIGSLILSRVGCVLTVIWCMMEPPPALSPKTVTLFGSPVTRLANFCLQIGSRTLTAKEVDVVLYPFEGKPLVVKSCICCAVLLESGSRRPSHCTEAIVHSHVDDAAGVVTPRTFQQPGRIARARFGASRVSASIDPDEDWMSCVRIENVFWNHDIEEQTVLVLSRVCCSCKAAGDGCVKGRWGKVPLPLQILGDELSSNQCPCRVCLRTNTSEVACLYLCPIHSRSLRSRKTQIAHRGSGVANV